MAGASFLQGALKRVRQAPVRTTAPYALGRFESIRRGYGFAMSGLQNWGVVPSLDPCRASLFDGIDVEQALTGLRQDAVFPGLRLPPSTLERLQTFVSDSELRHWRTERIFRAEEVVDGHFPDGSPAVLADVVDAHLNGDLCRIAHDPVILSTLTRYLGYAPIKVDQRILFSFGSELSETTRAHYGQTIHYHYDVHGYNFGYVNIYLSDADADSGAHQMVYGSHIDKPWRWLLASARQSSEQIEDCYEPARIRVLEGRAGEGFIQDSSCCHRARPPRTANRVMIHLRYY